MNPRVVLALVLAAFLGWSHWKVYDIGKSGAEAACAQRERDAEEAQRTKADTASESHEVAREQIKTEVQTVVREVPRVVEKPVYRNVCIDPDGLRLIGRALGGGGVAGESAPAVPGAGGAR